MTRSLTALAAVCGLVTLEAAAPSLIMFSGGSLERPVVLSNSHENLTFLQQVDTGRAVDVEPLRNRPFLNVSLFWGPQWSQFVQAGRLLSDLRPEQANQHGRFYLATDTAPAVLILTPPPAHFDRTHAMPKSLDEFASSGIVTAVPLRVLEKAGIPVRR